MSTSLYGDLLAAGVPIDNHESDLYFLDCEQSRAILAKFPESAKLARPFWSALDSDQKWWDVPFAFLPWWEKRATANSLRAGETVPVRIEELIEPRDLKD